MTTEIAVSNKLGIALATDSAVTISGNGRVKVFDSADKLFELSSRYPIGVMINGNMECIGVPWEILVKDFRESEGMKSRDTVSEWAQHFLGYVQRHPLVEAAAVSNKYVDWIIRNEIISLQNDVANSVRKEIFDAASKNRTAQLQNADTLISEYFQRRTNVMSAFPVADSLKGITADQVIARCGVRIEELAKEPLIKLTQTGLEGFKGIIAQALLRVLPSASATGVVVAGFGLRETFPAVYAVGVDGRVCKTMKLSTPIVSLIDASSEGGHVIPFAQTDVIQRLLGGADPRFVQRTCKFIEQNVGEVVRAIEKSLRTEKILEEDAANRKELVLEAVRTLRTQYENETAPELRKEFSLEFNRMIAMMPKQELIEFAEALVGITAVERKATADEGTVGGPIDVAFISKHEGFVWIKRKHYFAKELNPRYFWRKYGSPSQEAAP